MAWEVGTQKYQKRYSGINEIVRAKKGTLDEIEAKTLLYRFLRENVTFGINLAMGVRLFPFQHMAIKAMMLCDYFMGIWARGCSKSYCTGIFAAYYALLNPGTEIGILSRTFRQSKLIFKKIEDICQLKEAELFKQCVSNVSKSSDEWLMEIGTSKIRALPLGDGEKLRGFRFHVVIVDEFLLMPEKIYNEVIKPFLSTVQNPGQRKELADLENELIEQGKMTEDERYRWPNNKLITLSSAGYTFDYIYTLYKQYEGLITGRIQKEKEDTAHRAIMHFSYDVVPKELYDQNLINESKATMSEAQFMREFGSLFTDDSSSYFRISKLGAVTYPDGQGQYVEIKGEEGAEYIISIDPSWAETESSDDFAIHVIKLSKDRKTGTIVHSYAVHGGNAKNHILYFYYLYTNFNVVFIVFDYMGGVQFLKAVNESKVFKDAKIEFKTIETTEIDEIETYQEGLKEVRSQYNRLDHRICFMRNPSPKWIRFANELLQSNIDHKKIWFAGLPMDKDWHAQLKKNIPIGSLVFRSGKDFESLYEETNEHDKLIAKKADLIENIPIVINMTKAQCAIIVPTTTANGSQTFDLPSNLRKTTGENKVRKDSYSCLVLGNWALKIFGDAFDPSVSHEKPPPFLPFFVNR
jgi:hypothetical protein